MDFTLDAKTPVLLFKLGHYPIQHGALGAARSLGSLGVKVYAVVEDRFTPLATSRYIAGSFLWKGGQRSVDGMIAALMAMRKRLDRPAILLPTEDAASVFLAEHASDLNPYFLSPPVSSSLPGCLSNKGDLYRLCKTLGEPCPEVTLPASQDELEALIESVSFPVVIKRAESRQETNGIRSTAIIRSKKELIGLCRGYRNFAPGDLLIQEYIPEEFSEDWIFHAYCNPQTSCLVSFTGKKLRSYPAFAGVTTLGVSLDNEVLTKQARRLLQEVCYAGIADLDFRYDRRGGEYKLLDFNPRIGANFRLFKDRNGMDVVRALHLDLTGRRLPKASSVTGRKFIVEPLDLATSLQYMRLGSLTVRQWWRSIRGEKELAWFALDDPMPAVMAYIRLIMRAVGSRVRAILEPLAARIG